MRILSVCGSLGRGGTERVVQNFTLAYQRAGHAVAVLSAEQGGPRKTVLENAGVPVFLGQGDLAQAVHQADDFKPDLIHIHRAGIRNDRESDILRRLRKPDRRILETNVFARVDFSSGADLVDIHFHLTDWCLWRWRQWLGARAAKHVGMVLPNAVEPASFIRASDAERAAFRQSLHIPDEAYVCGRVGSASPANWHPQILHAFRAVAERDAGAHLILLGLPGSLRPVLESLPGSVRQRVHELPATDSDVELSRIYSSLDCFVHSAASGESFGMVLTEAMLCGCPAITSSRPHKSNSQVIVVDHLRAGLVAGSARRLPEAAIRMWSDGTLRATLAAAARASIVDRFSASRLAAQAVQAGSIALSTTDRTKLRQRLADAGFRTHTPTHQIRSLLQNTLGDADPLEIAAMKVLHLPAVHRMVYEYLKWRVGRRGRRAN